MKKFLLLPITFLYCAAIAQGAVISPEEALQRMIAERGQDLPTRGTGNPELLFTSRLSSGEAAVYVFNNPGTTGYWVLSADDSAAPVLGYSSGGAFNAEEMPEQMKWWIEEYGRQINYARENGIPAYAPSTRSARKPVDPLVKTKWDQGAPFNRQCPEIKGKRALTGCVATAMAQVMKYWNYPELGTGTGSVTVSQTSETLSMSFSEQKFDWTNMLDWYGSGAIYTDMQADAVAYLMKACGYSCDMNYDLTASGSLGMHAGVALINNFKYNPNMQFLDRDYFTAEQWENLLYDELAGGRPVLYGGVSPSGGHEFVCDGYSSDGYFHFNWGWSGMSDGYFLLNALNPGDLGNGGGEGGGFNYGQDIIIGIQPTAAPAESPRLVQLGNLKVVSKFNTLSLRVEYGESSGFWVNMGLVPVNVDLGVSIEPVDGNSGSVKYVTFGTGNLNIPQTELTADGYYSVRYSGFSNGDITVPSGLSDGKYKLTICSKGKDSPDTEYVPVFCGDDGYNYAYFTKSGSTYTVENMSAPEIIVKGGGAVSEVYYALAARMTLTVSNNSEKEITKTFFPRLVYGSTILESSNGVTVTMNPDETVTREFTTVFEVESGMSAPAVTRNYTLLFYDPETNGTYDWSSEVTVNTDVADPVFTVSDFEMPGCSYRDVVLNDADHTPTKLYSVTDIAEMPFSCKVNVEKGYLGSPLYLAICLNENGNSNLVNGSVFGEVPTLSAGQSVKIAQTVDFSAGVEGSTYVAYVCTAQGSQLIPVSNLAPIFFIISGSGIEGVTADSGSLTVSYDRISGEVSVESPDGIASVGIYSLDGKSVSADVSVSENTARVSLSGLPSGMYIVRALDKKGNGKTLKVMR